jgi:predicted NAD-dependent protein-ADP-ribosyltransferase YbiA (DUF1768 family)
MFFSILLNLHPAKFEKNGITFFSSEQFMMYQKALFFGDKATENLILAKNEHPLAKDFMNGKIDAQTILKSSWQEWNTLQSSVKALGKKVKHYDNEKWGQNRFRLVAEGVLAKFQQNEDLRKYLLNTGNDILVEASPTDEIWGIGLSESDAKVTPPERWKGQNLLGKVLMDVRSQVK